MKFKVSAWDEYVLVNKGYICFRVDARSRALLTGRASRTTASGFESWLRAAVTQMIEWLFCKQRVGGLSPSSSSTQAWSESVFIVMLSFHRGAGWLSAPQYAVIV